MTRRDEIDELLEEAQYFADHWTIDQIDDFVDSEFLSFTGSQKSFLKKIGKAILYLLKAR